MSSSGRSPGRLSSSLCRALVVVAATLSMFAWSRPAAAYPWMIRHGFDKCASCHTDPMGGELLTGFGRVISNTTLTTRYDGGNDPQRAAMLFYGVAEPDWLRFGGSVRVMDADYQFAQGKNPSKFDYFPMQMDAYGQATIWKRLRISASIGVGDATQGRIESRAAQITKASANANGELTLISRTHWVGYDVSDDVLIRAGRLNLPFGLRIPEHVMWVRSATRTDRESEQQDGVAIDYSHGRFRGEIMGIAGNYQISPDKFRERGYSAYAEYMLSPHAAIGASSLTTHAADDRFLVNGQGYTRGAHGLTARVSPVEPLVFMAEGDLLVSNQTLLGYVGMLQMDWEFVQGLHAMVTGEVLDAGESAAANVASTTGHGKPEFDQWLTFGWFFFTHFDFRTDLIIAEPKSVAPVTVLSQFHYYF